MDWSWGAGINDVYFHRQISQADWQAYLENWPEIFNRLCEHLSKQFNPQFMLCLDVSAGFEDPPLTRTPPQLSTSF